MKRLNGSGTVVKLSGKRRRPFMALVSIKTSSGDCIRKRLGVYTTMDEALSALLAYNSNPHEIDTKKITFSELYTMWREKSILRGKLAQSTLNSYNHKYTKYCAPLYNLAYADIKHHMFQSIIDNCGGGHSSQNSIKAVFRDVEQHAIALGIISGEKLKGLETAKKLNSNRTIYNDAEIKLLWDNKDTPWIDTVLILIYSGWRRQELLDLKKDDIDFNKHGGIMIGGGKTEAGKNRVVPIHSAILPLIKKRMATNDNYLITSKNKQMRGDAYYIRTKRVLKTIGITRIPHETRHTFISLLDRFGVSQLTIKKIVGHSGDVTEHYTHKTIEELREAVEKIKVPK